MWIGFCFCSNKFQLLLGLPYGGNAYIYTWSRMKAHENCPISEMEFLYRCAYLSILFCKYLDNLFKDLCSFGGVFVLDLLQKRRVDRFLKMKIDFLIV